MAYNNRQCNFLSYEDVIKSDFPVRNHDARGFRRGFKQHMYHFCVCPAYQCLNYWKPKGYIFLICVIILDVPQMTKLAYRSYESHPTLSPKSKQQLLGGRLLPWAWFMNNRITWILLCSNLIISLFKNTCTQGKSKISIF